VTTEQTEWTTEQVVAAFRAEVQARFEAENAAHRAEDARQLAEIREKRGEVEFQRLMGDISVRDSFFWDIYSGAEFHAPNNLVKVVLPRGYAVYTKFVEMFADTSTAWMYPVVGAEIADDGEAHVTIEVLLTDYWDDKRAAEWAADKTKTAHDTHRVCFDDNERLRQIVELELAREYWRTKYEAERNKP
jgi:hypothetical protein